MTSNNNKPFYFMLIFIGSCGAIYIYSLSRNYLVRNCQNTFGASYNAKRKDIGLPLLPINWHIKERDAKYIWWTGDQSGIGHSRKTIAFSGCDILDELDVYTLPVRNGKERLLEIECKYKKNRPDVIIYTYEIGNLAEQVSKVAADSILQKDHINPGY